METHDQNQSYTLRQNDVSLLMEILKSNNLKMKVKNSRKHAIYKEIYCYYLELTNLELDMLLDELTYALTSQGIQKNSEPNAYGLKIESLIDIFTHYPEP